MVDSNSYLLHQEACPKCRQQGNDQHGDNLAVYSDSHKYCYRCGYYVRGDGLSFDNSSELVEEKPNIRLPHDIDINISNVATRWLEQYELDHHDILKHGVLWSDHGINYSRKGSYNRSDGALIFPLWHDGNLLGYTARTFDGVSPKWLTRGKLDKIYHILEGNTREEVVLVEDIVSAIKVQKAGYTAMPVFGSKFTNRVETLKILGYKLLYVWLDPDMYSSMIKQCARVTAIQTRIVFSDCDPKEHTCTEIRDYLL